MTETQKETPDMVLDCFGAVSKKISGMHTEIGADDSVWLMPDREDMPGAAMWRSRKDFLLGDTAGCYSIFGLACINGIREECIWSRFLLANRWMDSLQSCSSLEELQLMMACIG